jgi:hypothetical protein
MDWLTFAALVIAAGVFVFAVIVDRKNASALQHLYELILNLIDESKEKPE